MQPASFTFGRAVSRSHCASGSASSTETTPLRVATFLDRVTGTGEHLFRVEHQQYGTVAHQCRAAKVARSGQDALHRLDDHFGALLEAVNHQTDIVTAGS